MSSRILHKVLLLGLAIALCGTARAQVASQSALQSETPALQNPDVDAIRAAAQAFVEAFNRGDAPAVAALWTDEGEYIDESGARFAGRDAIEKCYAEFFASHPGAKIHIAIDSVRLVSSAAAIEEGHAILESATADAPGGNRYTAVHVKTDGVWRMASVRDSRADAPAPHSPLADLGWLVGSWTSEDHGATTESVCTWVANNSFVQRNYTVTGVGGAKTSGVQLIGWNAELGHVQSWNFSPDGGHAVGVWAPHPGGWTATMRGVTGDGVPTSAVNVLTRLDDNAYSWQSARRSADGVALPDTDEIIVKRASPKP